MLLTKEQINEADDRPTLELEIPMWDGSVLLKTLSAAQKDNFDASIIDKDGNATKLSNLRARFASLVLVDEGGEPLYTEQQAAQLGNKSSAALGLIWDKGREFNKMDADAVKDAEENSEAAQGGNSGTSLPLPSAGQP